MLFISRITRRIKQKKSNKTEQEKENYKKKNNKLLFIIYSEAKYIDALKLFNKKKTYCRTLRLFQIEYINFV